jgi:hypothetical protein
MFEARGTSGVVRCGYQTAARLGSWRVVTVNATLGGPTSTLTARVSGQPSWWLTQRPLEVDLQLDTSVWTWPVQVVRVSEGTLTATLPGMPVVKQGGTWERTDSSCRSWSRST